MSNSLLNKRACRDFALRWAQEKRLGWGPTRVAASFLAEIDARVRLLIMGAVSKHRTVGETIKDFQ